jgi:hypothetical protein
MTFGPRPPVNQKLLGSDCLGRHGLAAQQHADWLSRQPTAAQQLLAARSSSSAAAQQLPLRCASHVIAGGKISKNRLNYSVFKLDFFYID